MKLGILASHPIQYFAPYYRALVAAGVDLEVLYCHDHGLEPAWDKGFGRMVKYDTPLLDGYRHHFLRNFSGHPGLRFWGQINPGALARARRENYDALLVHGYASAATLAAILGPRGPRPKVLLRGDSNLRSPRSFARRATKHVALRLLFSRIDHFLAAGTRNAEYYAAYGVKSDRITVAPFAVDNDLFARSAMNVATRLKARRRLALPESAPVFLYCGKLLAIKRPLDLVRAFAVARQVGRCALVLVGEGEQEGSLRDLIADLGLGDDVHMLGFRNQGELPEIYGACDALALPSSFEAWGLVVNEAMAAGLAIATSDAVGAAPDLVRGNGFTFQVGDVEELARGLSSWVANPGLLAAAREESRKIIANWGLREAVAGTIRGVERALTQ